ncbi:MAG: PD40 domain-containing protein [Candidatus Marinimicrobia bacterium]|nr:PD40 domain-containing protein [Candidatus Neomarinimicrobiota bacterium]
MKRRGLLISILLIFSITGFGQQINVLKTVTIPTGNSDFMAPRFSPDGSKVLFTQSGFRGLWLYDLSDKSIMQLNDYQGAGYEAEFTPDGKQVIFKIDEYSGMKKYSSLAVQPFNDKNITYIVRKIRHLSNVRWVNNHTAVYREGNEIKAYNVARNESAKSNSITAPYAFIENNKLVVYRDGKRKTLQPLGEKGHYIWLSLSPDKSRLLFTVTGKGTFVTDLEGNVLADLGYANAPKWSPDGKWIVYMVDEDDGHTMTASDIWAVSSDEQKRFQLTKTADKIEMYPCWSPAMDKIAFDTFDGKIVYLEIEISN